MARVALGYRLMALLWAYRPALSAYRLEWLYHLEWVDCLEWVYRLALMACRLVPVLGYRLARASLGASKALASPLALLGWSGWVKVILLLAMG